jgi:hypothetical protein
LSTTAGTTGGTAIVAKGATNTVETIVDANGKLTNVNSGTGAAGSSASLTLTNGLGNTHGLVVTETQATLSGGTHSSSLTLNDNGATFSNAQTGAPVQVHGVANGTSDYDAVNVRQFAGAIAAAAASARIPALDAGKTFSVGAGYGSYMGKNALAVGANLRVNANTTVGASLATGTDSSSKALFSVGGAMSW